MHAQIWVSLKIRGKKSGAAEARRLFRSRSLKIQLTYFVKTSNRLVVYPHDDWGTSLCLFCFVLVQETSVRPKGESDDLLSVNRKAVDFCKYGARHPTYRTALIIADDFARCRREELTSGSMTMMRRFKREEQERFPPVQFSSASR